jgi:hypothetical protein
LASLVDLCILVGKLSFFSPLERVIF